MPKKPQLRPRQASLASIGQVRPTPEKIMRRLNDKITELCKSATWQPHEWDLRAFGEWLVFRASPQTRDISHEVRGKSVELYIASCGEMGATPDVPSYLAPNPVKKPEAISYIDWGTQLAPILQPAKPLPATQFESKLLAEIRNNAPKDGISGEQLQSAIDYAQLLLQGIWQRPQAVEASTAEKVRDYYRTLRPQFSGEITEPFELRADRLHLAVYNMLLRSKGEKHWHEREFGHAILYARSLTNNDVKAPIDIAKKVAKTARQHFVFAYLLMEDEFKDRKPSGCVCNWFGTLRKELQPLAQAFLHGGSS